MSARKAKASQFAANQGAGQAAAQVLVWGLELALGEGAVPPEVAVALGVLIGDVAYRLKWNRLLKRVKEGEK
jgi:hypothetical protein